MSKGDKPDITAWMTAAADETEDIYYDQDDLNKKTGKHYPSWEVAWLGYYEVDINYAGVYYATCNQHANGPGCGMKFTSIDRSMLRNAIERHIINDGVSTIHALKKLDFKGEIPF